MQQLLHGIPHVRQNVARQRSRARRLDDVEPVRPAFYVRQPVEEAEQGEEGGEAIEQPRGRSLYLGDNPVRMRH